MASIILLPHLYYKNTIITEDVGAAKTIKKSVDNLVREGYLETRKSGRQIIYKFNNKNNLIVKILIYYNCRLNK